MNGMPRETPQVLGGRKALEVLERIYGKVRSEEAGLAMQAALSRAAAHLDGDEFLKDLDVDLTLVGDGEVGQARGPNTR